MRDFKEHQRHYRRNHSTLGCKVTHMFGIPLIALSVPLLLFKPKLALKFFAVGWVFQFIGHFIFEKNKPVLFNDPKNPFTYVSALIFVGHEWLRFLRGQALVYKEADEEIVDADFTNADDERVAQ